MPAAPLLCRVQMGSYLLRQAAGQPGLWDRELAELGARRTGLGAAPGRAGKGRAGRTAGGGSAASPAFQSPSLRGGNREIFPAAIAAAAEGGGGLEPRRGDGGFLRGGMWREGRLPAGRAG